MSMINMRASQRQEAHQKANELIVVAKYDEAVQALVYALQHYGPNINMLMDLSLLFLSQNDFNQYYFFGRKVEIEWTQAESDLSTTSAVRVAQFLGRFFDDRGEMTRSLHYYDIALRRADDVAVHVNSMTSLLKIYSSFGYHKETTAYYDQVIKLSSGLPEMAFVVESALLQADLLLSGIDKGLVRLQTFGRVHGYQQSGFHQMIIELLEQCMVDGVDLSNQRESIIEMLNLINPFELSTYDKIVIQFFYKQHYFLSATEMNYLQQNLTNHAIIKSYFMNLSHCQNAMTKKDLTALFDLMIRDFDVRTHKMFRQKYFKENIDARTWNIFLDSKQMKLVTVEGSLPIRHDELDFLLSLVGTKSKVRMKKSTLFEMKEVIARVNQRLFMLTETANAIELNGDELLIANNIQIHTKDSYQIN